MAVEHPTAWTRRQLISFFKDACKGSGQTVPSQQAPSCPECGHKVEAAWDHVWH